MRITRIAIIGGVVVGLLLAALACASAGTGGPASFAQRVRSLTTVDLEGREETNGRRDRVTTIHIDATRFQPREVTVSAGDTIVWVNEDPFPHNVSSDAGGFHSGDLAPDRSWRFRPESRGTFRYVCTLHPTMAAVVRVK